MAAKGDIAAKEKGKHFPFISPSRIVFCGEKEILNGDYLSDDHCCHFARFRGLGILFSAPTTLANGRSSSAASTANAAQ